MIENADLPHILAAINITTACILTIAFIMIKRGNREAHRAFMITALVLGVIFLIVYTIYHANSGLAKFGGVGPVRTFYFTLLLAHVTMAVVSVVLIPWTAIRGLRQRFSHHKKIARWTLPIWFFVSVSGVVIYIMTIHIYPWTGA